MGLRHLRHWNSWHCVKQTKSNIIIKKKTKQKLKYWKRKREVWGTGEKEIYIPSPKDWLLPVKRKVTGHDPVLLQESFGKVENGKMSVCTARYWGAGSCNNGGHSGGLGIAQVPTWSVSEYSTPQTFSRHRPPSVLVQVQPHLFSGLFTSWSISPWRRTSSTQRISGDKMSRIFVHTFRFCKHRCA